MTEKEQPGLIEQNIHISEDEISLRDLLLTLIREKRTIIACTLVVFLTVTVVSLVIPHVHIGTKGTVQTALQLYFPGIETGNTPDGQQYDANEIKSAEVLQRAIAYAGLENKNIPLTLLKANIKFEALLPENVVITLNQLEKIKDENIKLQRLESMEINPDAYIVKLNVSRSLGISMEEARVLLDNVILAYKDWLIQRYAAMPELSNVFQSSLNLSDYDYIQAVDMLDKQLSDMEIYVDTMISIGDTKSLTRQAMQEMQEVQAVLQSIRTVEVEGLYTKIAAFYITKDPQKTEAVYRQMAKEGIKAAAQSAEEAVSLRSIIDGYHSEEQMIAFGEQAVTSLTLQNESQQYNEFVTQYTDAKSREAKARAEADYYLRQAERFAGGGMSAGAESAAAKEVEESIGEMKQKLTYWVDEINRAEDIYLKDIAYQQYAEQMIPANAYRQESSINLLMNMAIGLAAGLFMGILLVLLKEFLRDEK